MCSVESSTASLLNHGPTAKEKLKVFCKPTYRIKRLKNKGAILVLAWSFLLSSTYFFNAKITAGHELLFNVQLVIGGLTLPIAGWLADVYFGRYKVICWSTWIMWVASMLVTASSIVSQLVDNYDQVHSYVSKVLMAMVAIGLSGFQANVIQFGIDQLHDASTTEIISFIRWYGWSTFISGFIIDYVLGCAPREYQVLIGMLVMSVYLSIALSSTFLFNHWLVKEPVTQNPFKMVYKVIKYAIKTKHPRSRSAFTYCEDMLPSRIDFGKVKYGGPFTTEQVEDVKTFLRLLVIISVGSCLFGEVIAVDILRLKVSNWLTGSHDLVTGSLYTCYSEEAFKQFFIYCGAIAIPFYEFFFYPVFYRCLVTVRSQRKFAFGVILQIATIISLMLVETVARCSYLENNTNTNTTTIIHCVFYEAHHVLSTTFDHRWMAVPYFFRSISILLLGIGTIEFIAAQAPYSMRGLIMGTAYGMFLLSAALGIAISIPFTKRLSVWGTGVISCGFWYALLLLFIAVTAGVTLTVVQMWYKKRKREDVLPNEHIFAERYYARELES